jgi:hypothetical protein
VLAEHQRVLRAAFNEHDGREVHGEHAWVFSQLTGSPVVVLQERS